MNSTEQQQLIVEKIRTIIDAGYDSIFERFDKLHSQGIHDGDVVAALRSLHEMDILDSYAEWADIDLREDDNTTTNPDGVTDPGTNPSDLQMAAALGVKVPNPAVITTVEQLALLSDRVILALKGGGAGQIRRDDAMHCLFLAGSDLWENIMERDDDDQWQLVGAGERRSLAGFLPAVALGVSKVSTETEALTGEQRDDTQRYGHYSSVNQSRLMMLRRLLKEES